MFRLRNKTIIFSYTLLSGGYSGLKVTLNLRRDCIYGVDCDQTVTEREAIWSHYTSGRLVNECDQMF